jgi:hypothetical protein
MGYQRNLFTEGKRPEFTNGLTTCYVKTTTQQGFTQPGFKSSTMAGQVVNGACHHA